MMEPALKFKNFKTLHQFRSLSEHDKEAKGGYIEGTIVIPHGVNMFALSLFDPESDAQFSGNDCHNDSNKHHPNFLYVTPVAGRRENKKFDSNRCFQIRFSVNGDELIPNSDDLPYLQGNCTLSSSKHGLCWNAESRELELGRGKLQMGVVKVGLKGQSSKLNLEKVKKERTIAANANLAKVKLGLINLSNGMVYTSPVIYDSGKYFLELERIEPRVICCNTYTKPVIKVIFNRCNLSQRQHKMEASIKEGDTIEDVADPLAPAVVIAASDQPPVNYGPKVWEFIMDWKAEAIFPQKATYEIKVYMDDSCSKTLEQTVDIVNCVGMSDCISCRNMNENRKADRKRVNEELDPGPPLKVYVNCIGAWQVDGPGANTVPRYAGAKGRSSRANEDFGYHVSPLTTPNADPFEAWQADGPCAKTVPRYNGTSEKHSRLQAPNTEDWNVLFSKKFVACVFLSALAFYVKSMLF